MTFSDFLSRSSDPPPIKKPDQTTNRQEGTQRGRRESTKSSRQAGRGSKRGQMSVARRRDRRTGRDRSWTWNGTMRLNRGSLGNLLQDEASCAIYSFSVDVQPTQRSEWTFSSPFYTSPFRPIFGDVRRCSAMFGDVRRCSAMFGDVRRCSAMFGDIIRASIHDRDNYISCYKEIFCMAYGNSVR